MLKSLFTGVTVLALSATGAIADALDDIAARGKIVVGVKADYAPWGMRDADGNLIGMEHDMIDDFVTRVSDAVGKPIELEKVVVVASNRMQFLEQGKVDMFIATMSNKPERREVVGIVQPDYYSSGVAVLAHKDSGIDGWESLEGKKICGIQGAWYNKDHGLKNGAEIVAFKGVSEVEKALLDGRCDGWIYDDSAFIPRKVNEPEKWADYSIATPTVDDAPWGAAVPLDEVDGRLGKLLSEAIIDWHKSGTLVELEAKLGIPPTAWLAKMSEACKAGEKICNDAYDDE
ncbi:transporter substrate-binding domain-containing protein [Roseovarius sp. CAU 1744]|uniref:transporter substrate-binding domain-containing protein n=1 Tax=Roseovarius sp. CAU 1744 TaxID=3140368 RepID=UPI00325B233E